MELLLLSIALYLLVGVMIAGMAAATWDAERYGGAYDFRMFVLFALNWGWLVPWAALRGRPQP